MNLMAKLWAWGQRIDWPMMNEAEPRRRAHLPGHPFKRTEHCLLTSFSENQVEDARGLGGDDIDRE